MKKIFAILILVGCMLSMSSCGLVIDVVCSQVFNDYEGEDTVFSYDNFSITLTDSFEPNEIEEGYYSLYSVSGTSVEIIRYDYLDSDIPSDKPLAEQAEVVRGRFVLEDGEEGIPLAYDVSELVESDGLTYFTLNMFLPLHYKTIMFFYEDEDAMWGVTFTCLGLSYAENEPYFIEWAKSADLSDVHTQV